MLRMRGCDMAAGLIAGTEPLCAYVVFTDETTVRWLRFLRPGFRHCFVMVGDGEKWVSIDPLLSRIQIMIHDAPAIIDIIKYLRESDHVVVSVNLSLADCSLYQPALLHCVSVVKRIIGVRSYRVQTPWQLYKFLEARRLSKIEKGEVDVGSK